MGWLSVQTSGGMYIQFHVKNSFFFGEGGVFWQTEELIIYGIMSLQATIKSHSLEVSRIACYLEVKSSQSHTPETLQQLNFVFKWMWDYLPWSIMTCYIHCGSDFCPGPLVVTLTVVSYIGYVVKPLLLLPQMLHSLHPSTFMQSLPSM